MFHHSSDPPLPSCFILFPLCLSGTSSPEGFGVPQPQCFIASVLYLSTELFFITGLRPFWAWRLSAQIHHLLTDPPTDLKHSFIWTVQTLWFVQQKETVSKNGRDFERFICYIIKKTTNRLQCKGVFSILRRHWENRLSKCCFPNMKLTMVAPSKASSSRPQQRH